MQNLTESDWWKLARMVKFLKQTVNNQLTLSTDGTRKLHWHVDASFAVHPDFTRKLHWHVDASFAVHPDFRSHTGATFKMG